MVKMIHAKASQLMGPMKISTNARVEESSRSNIDIVINQSVDHQRKSFAPNKYRTESQLNSRKHSLKQVHEENSENYLITNFSSPWRRFSMTPGRKLFTKKIFPGNGGIFI